ncbi:MAG: Flp pilus assembly complex ATPase component TadA [Anaerolineae bacterium]|nr:Flp pilus assembly complex ATPase component TadA [Gemmatimonadaceae bacterium]
MAKRRPRDEWLLPTLSALIPREDVALLTDASPDSYWEEAVRRGLISDDKILATLSAKFNMRIANLDSVSAQSRDLVPEQLARKYRIVPLSATETVLEIAASNPNDLDAERAIAFATGRTLKMQLAAPSRLTQRIDELYRPENVVERILEGVNADYEIESMDASANAAELDLSADSVSERPITRLVDFILAEGITTRASDIHIETEENEVTIRYRIDGVLRQVMAFPRAIGVPLVSRIKIMSGLDIADRLRPQDGRARVAINQMPVDLRISTLPAAHGEKIVIRILDSRGMVLSLERMGLHPEELERINELLQSREGFILVTGPTGSGKTTTLYSALKSIQARGVNIITVEDPVEYRIAGIVQVQVHEKANLTFATALRSILRQDPDVVLVGEIRDRDTASIAVQASLTGHLVLSTLHTIDAASSITRLSDIGVDAYKIAAALKGIIAQRLLRRLCQACREPATDEIPERLRQWLPEGSLHYRPVGCVECATTGYRGRVAVVEILMVSRDVERRISAGEPSERIAEAARANGMKSLWDSGIGHVLIGNTSLDEVLRVLDIPIDRRAAPDKPASVTKAPARKLISPEVDALPKLAPRPTGQAFELIENLVPGETPAEGFPSVLLVEDEEPLRRVLRDVLEREGFTILEAANGAHALAEIDRSAPDLVVLDLNLPDIDGYEVLRRLRARPGTATTRVLVLTARGDEESEVKVFEAGADDYLTKPFRARALTARIRALVQRR